MKIAQVAPLYESVPPMMYGGTERVVSYLTEELVALGHDVTLFASADSRTKAKLISASSTGLRLNKNCIDPLAYHAVQLQQVFERADEFDVLHFHTDYMHYPFSESHSTASVTTLHGRLDLPDLKPLYKKFNHVPLISISNFQRTPFPDLNWIDTIYHGLPLDLYREGPGNGNYLAFVGRISPEKRVDRAIEIAKRSGIPIKIAAKIDKADEEYFDMQIKHLFDDPMVEYVGEINETQKDSFYGNALATLFPIDWPEPFGLVIIESMACGTPVIAYDMGSVPEIVSDGVTGFIVSNIKEAVNAVKNIQAISRLGCRRIFEDNFSARIMAEHYLRNYGKLMDVKREERSMKFANGTGK